MSCAVGPKVVLDDLLVNLDAANIKSYPYHPGPWKNLINQTNAALENGVLYSGDHMEFDGVDDYVNIPNTNYPATWSDPFSMECWINIPSSATWTSPSNVSSNIIIRGSYTGCHGIARSTTNNVISTYIRGDAESKITYATITRDAWYHVVGTWNGSTTSIFVNGDLIQTSSAVTHTGIPESDTWRVGQAYAFGGTVGNPYQGSIAGVKIYAKSLSPQEVKINFESQRGRFSL